MALDQEFFDSIQIDIVKRKYYNANKVNAVLGEIREQAAILMAENEHLRAELKERASVQNRIKTKAEEELLRIQEAYRLTLEKANSRADTVISQAEEKSRTLTVEAERKAELAAHSFEECIRVLRDREEQNISFLNARMHSFLASLYDVTSTSEDTIGLDSAKKIASKPQNNPLYQSDRPKSEIELEVSGSKIAAPFEARENYDDMEEKISRLASKIYEMEER